MKDYTNRDWDKKPKWYRALINLKWKYIQANRKTHGRLTLLLVIGLLAIIIFMPRGEMSQDTINAQRAVYCLVKGGCVLNV